jgi:hypothetical protein
VPPARPPYETARTWMDKMPRDLEAPGPGMDAPMGTEPCDADRINYAAVEFELDRMKKRIAIWEIFARYMKDGADSWPRVQHALSPEDINEIVRICEGIPLRDVLLDPD